LPISRFDPVLVETLPVFVAQSPLQVLLRPGAAMREPVGGSGRCRLAPLGLFARHAKIDHRTHAQTRGSNPLPELAIHRQITVLASDFAKLA